jgi:hypothetical protein
MWTIPLDPVGAALGFPNDVLNRGRGYSISRQLQRIGYRQIRPFLNEALLETRLQARPELIDPWLAYSDDKRTSGGWYLTRDGESWVVGRLGTKTEGAVADSFSVGARATAVFVLRELDFWDQVGQSSPIARMLGRFFRLFG